MRYLVVGKGSRESAIRWMLEQERNVSWVGVISEQETTERIAKEAREREATVIIGPDKPLAEGLADSLRKYGIRVFGPSQAAAKIEWSKSFAKRLMWECGIPTASAEIFDDFASALEYVKTCELPIVIKADGLALGKGVKIARTRTQANQIVREFMEKRTLGVAGDVILFERMLQGREVSVFAFCNGRKVALPLVSACDYKQAYEGGPNTGGMGSYSPAEFWNEELAVVALGIIQKALDALAERGAPFQGMLYLGLMITDEGPQVIEFNARFGDPETQVILPRLKTPFSEVIEATIDGKLADLRLEWSNEVCVGVVLASRGYPDRPEVGYPISGLDQINQNVFGFLGGVRQEGEVLKTASGRVITLVTLASTYKEARSRLSRNAEKVSFKGKWYRRDIAKAL